MLKMLGISCLLLLVFAVAAPVVQASGGRVSTADELGELRSGIEAEMRLGGEYEGATRAHKRELDALFNRMQSTLSRVDHVDDLPPRRQVALFNDQDRVNVLLTQAREGDRQICRRERQIGTNMRTTVCRTQQEWDDDRNQSREAVRQMQRDQGRDNSDRGVLNRQ